MSEIDTHASGDWVSTTMGALGRLHCGQSPPAPEVNTDGRGIPYISGPEQWDGQQIHQVKWTTAGSRIAPTNSIFITVKGAGVGKIFPGIAGAIGRDIYAFEPSLHTDTRFVYHALQYSIQDVIAKARGDIPGLSKDHILEHRIFVPGLKTQQAVASKIDELFSRIEEGERALERVQKLVERYRQSVLKAAVTGELTRKWRQKHDGQLDSGEALLARILKARREAWEKGELDRMKATGQKPAENNWKSKYKEPIPPDTTDLQELPKGWIWASLDQLLVRIEAGKSFRCDERPPKLNEYGIVKVSAVTWGTFDEQESKTITESDRINSAYLIRPGDFLFSRANTLELVGACVLVRNVNLKLLLSDKILRFLFAVDLKWWVSTVLKSRFGRDQIERLSTGNQESMRNIGQERIKKIVIPLPSEKEIRTLSDEMSRKDQLKDEGFRTESAASKRALALRHAILRSAFSGQLVPQYPGDEPASSLLRRIADERNKSTKQAAPKRGGKKKAST